MDWYCYNLNLLDPVGVYLPLSWSWTIGGIYQLAHLNIRSFLSKYDQIQHLLTASNLDILCFSETWLDHNAALDISGSNLYRRDRDSSKKGGGVMAYVKNSMKWHSMQWSNMHLEYLGLFRYFTIHYCFITGISDHNVILVTRKLTNTHFNNTAKNNRTSGIP